MGEKKADWRREGFPKVTTLETGGRFKHYDLHKVQSLEVSLDALSLSILPGKVYPRGCQRKDTPPELYTRLCVGYVVLSRKRMKRGF